VPTIRFQVPYVFLVLAHNRRRILHFNETAHPTAAWTARALREAFPFDQLPRFLLRDRDATFGYDFREHLRNMGICEVLSAPRAPWQRAYVERVIGSVRRKCLDPVIVFHESSLRHILNSYFDSYHRSRTPLSLGKDSPQPRAIQPPGNGVRRGGVAGRWTAPPLRTTCCLKGSRIYFGCVLLVLAICPNSARETAAHRRVRFTRLKHGCPFVWRKASAIGCTEFSGGTIVDCGRRKENAKSNPSASQRSSMMSLKTS
jgi:hypothetical protein